MSPWNQPLDSEYPHVVSTERVKSNQVTLLSLSHTLVESNRFHIMVTREPNYHLIIINKYSLERGEIQICFMGPRHATRERSTEGVHFFEI